MAQATTNTTPPQTAPVLSFGAHIADPGPLGLAGFALTTFMLSSFNSGLAPKSAEVVVLGVALFYGGIAQLLAGMWEFAKGNTFGALAFSSYGAFWMSFWYLVSHGKDLPTTGTDAAKGIGVFLLAWTIFTLYMTVVASRLPGGRIPAAIGRLPPAVWVIGLGYALVARNRRAISRALRLDTVCEIPAR